ncbi:SDR family NAD(P)-dependent oxidoreductase [Rhodococcus sp. G-MC3]|uniref:SDR family NAD(P)-dependent oxidoreductase n=1 Tax=Rhodococcus sp. G-MC3 TaxID=3046209 RepID=UPI0024B8FC51|nr:SDR family NAD(P)-dependent oxidoreductase [Rhodococcus sp. G-MC3]MDJ0396642.1 SDR family NAD(P)-dependent oxidoreductase [Rhodococcus sp. G-MC3]
MRRRDNGRPGRDHTTGRGHRGRILARAADVRDSTQITNVFGEGVDLFGRVDIVLPNAGICAGGLSWEINEDAWREMLDINLTGVWNTVKAAVPTMIEQGDGGSIVFTGSTEALKGSSNIASYSASKHGVTGLMTSMARELGQYNIRVNSVNPTCVDTHMINNPFVYNLFRPDLTDPKRNDVVEAFTGTHILPVPCPLRCGRRYLPRPQLSTQRWWSLPTHCGCVRNHRRSSLRFEQPTRGPRSAPGSRPSPIR